VIDKVDAPGDPDLGDAFTRRVELSLVDADQRRRRRLWRQRVARVVPALLLISPVIGWRLMLARPDGVHVSVGALSWLTFILDVVVHIDSSVLRYLGLQALPTVVGVLLLIVITMWVLCAPRGNR
jgi:hypothetical protein